MSDSMQAPADQPPGPPSRDAEARSQPDFLCIGAQKAGTSWLYDQLVAHPAAWMPPFKELHYFDRRFRPERMRAALERPRKRRVFDARDRAFLEHAVTYTSEAIDFDWYGRLFVSKGRDITGDITPGYSTLPAEIVAEIAENLPSLKIVFLVRDPVERLWSQLALELRRRTGRVTTELDDWAALRTLAESPVFAMRSYPAQTARIWRQYFDPKQLFIGYFDDLQNRPDWLRARIFEFLQLDPDAGQGSLSADHNPKAGAWKPEMTPLIRERLAEFFRDEFRRCAEELGGPACDWPARYGM